MTRFSIKLTLLCTLFNLVLAPLSFGDDPNANIIKSLKTAFEQTNSFEDKFEAQVWLTSMSGRLKRWEPSNTERIKLLSLIHSEANRAGLEPGLVLALIQAESAFDNFAISSAGARGLMQIMPFWKKEIGREDDNLFDIPTNLRYGTTILAHYIDVEKGSIIRALARYNGSKGKTWYPNRVLTYWNKHWLSHD